MAKSEQQDSGRPILVAIDFSQHSAGVLLWAARMARSEKAPLIVLHVVHDPGSAPGYYSEAKKHRKHLTRIGEIANQMMTDFLDRMRREHPDLLQDVEESLVIGLPVSRILQVAEQTDAQLIVMGSRGRTGLKHALLGSKAEKVVQLSPIPVTIVKGLPPG